MKRNEKKAKPVLPAGVVPFEGFTWPFLLAALVVLGVPFLLNTLDVGEQIAGLVFAVGFMVICAVVAAWPPIDAAEGRTGLVVAAAFVALLGAGGGGYAIYQSIRPGDPVASAELAKADDEKPLPGIGDGAFDLMVHADFGEATGRDISANYGLQLAAPSGRQDVNGRFESRRGRGRVGRRTVSTVKPPREWTHHEVRLAAGPYTVRLVRKDAVLGGLEVRAYPLTPLWPLASGAGVLVLLAVGVAALVRDPTRRRYLVGGVAAAAIGGFIGSWWSWMGEPFYPLVGAAFIAMLAGWLVGKLLAPLAGSLPWAKR